MITEALWESMQFARLKSRLLTCCAQGACTLHALRWGLEKKLDLDDALRNELCDVIQDNPDE